jgi:ABC-type transport system substrate-binding protein
MHTRNRLAALSLDMLLVLAMIALSLSGCGPAPAEPSAPSPAPATQQAAQSPSEPSPTPLPAAPTPTPVPAGPATGGTVTVAFTEDPNSLDSILGYNLPAWQSLMNLYRGLMIYEGDRAVPDMADGWPEISPDGLVYTFKIKPGIKFHNGREVEAADFKYSLERVLDPDWASWANYYLISLKGAQEVIDGQTKEVSGIEVLDKYTIRFTLTAPDMTFLNVLALPNNWVVPKEEVEKWGQEFERHPVGTGPFMLKEFVPGEKAVFVRNPDFFHEGQPYIDETVIYFGIEPSTALLRMEKGELDVLFGDMIPAADFSRLINDSNYQDWLFREPSMYTWWVGLNNQMAPLDNPLVRQALNMAINREKIAKLSGGKGEVLWAIYPSQSPGFEPDYKPYPYDPDAAKAKLAEAGFADGLELELLIAEDPLEATIAQSIQQDLDQIGVKVSIKQVSDTVSYDMITAGEAQMYLNDWYMIQPDPADLINNLYMAGAGSNQDFYSNPKVDELAVQALAEQDREKRVKLYQDIEHLLMEDAVHVPLINSISYYMHNPRIQDFYSRSEYGPFFERMWIKP